LESLDLLGIGLILFGIAVDILIALVVGIVYGRRTRQPVRVIHVPYPVAPMATHRPQFHTAVMPVYDPRTESFRRPVDLAATMQFGRVMP
jgi:hypothetical protein